MIDIIVISNLSRPELFQQTMDSIDQNTDYKKQHSLTVVIDDPPAFPYVNKDPERESLGGKIIINSPRVGASRARNIGASSIPKYRRNKYVMFFDDDIYALPHWDTKLIELIECKNGIISGYGHPYNVAAPEFCYVHKLNYGTPLVISTCAMMMPWHIWDETGFFVEPGGTNGSEDHNFCMRAKDKGYGVFAVSEPHSIIHTGLGSTYGGKIVGFDELSAQNAKLERHYGIAGKVKYS
jgi:GT2 family glycosyltransferase